MVRDGSLIECIYFAEMGSLGFRVDGETLDPFPAFVGIAAEKVYPLVGSAVAAVTSMSVHTDVNDADMECDQPETVDTVTALSLKRAHAVDGDDAAMEELEAAMRRHTIERFKRRRVMPARRVKWDSTKGIWCDICESSDT